jgi:hypothetical protein
MRKPRWQCSAAPGFAWLDRSGLIPRRRRHHHPVAAIIAGPNHEWVLFAEPIRPAGPSCSNHGRFTTVAVTLRCVAAFEGGRYASPAVGVRHVSVSLSAMPPFPHLQAAAAEYTGENCPLPARQSRDCEHEKKDETVS